MDSDLAAKMQKEEDDKYAQDTSQDSQFPMESEITVTTELDEPSSFTGDEDNDYLVALMLQHEYNNEFNGMMKKYESAVNRNSKGKFTFPRSLVHRLITRSSQSLDEEFHAPTSRENPCRYW